MKADKYKWLHRTRTQH